MHVLRELLHQFERRIGKNAVSEIENMSGTASGTTEDVFGRGE